jgi:membrane protease YdiL (CAAX protease family)
MPTTSSPTSRRRSRTHSGKAAAIWLGVSVFLAATAFYFQSLDTEEDTSDALYDASFAVAGLIQYAILVLIALAIARPFPRPASALGLRRFRMRWVWISFIVVLVTLVVGIALEPILHGGEDQGLAPDEWQPEHAAAFALNTTLIVLLGPFAEELFFRGIGVRALTVFGVTTAILLSGIVFGAVHGVLGALPPLILFGIGLAWIRVRSASIWPGFIAHASYNGIGVAFLALSWAI